MLLRTTSAPVAQNLFSESPNSSLEYTLTNSHHEYCTTKRNLSFPHGFQHVSSFSCSSPPPVRSNSLGLKAVRRVQSDSNLEGLAFPTTEESSCSSRKSMNKSMLHTEPSFSIYDKFEELEELRNEEKEKEKEIGEGKLERSATIGESIEAQFSFGRDMMMRIIEEDEEGDKDEEKEGVSNRFKDLKIDAKRESRSPPIYLENTEVAGGDGVDLDTYYNTMVRKEPSNPLVLRNYAQFLESKKDFVGAEEYYSRALLADPKDGEILCKYAKLVWELHGDQTRASHYFKRATQASPEDSNVLAAHASFLWDVDESDDEECSSNIQVDEKPSKGGFPEREYVKEESRPSSPPLHLAMGLGLDVPSFDHGTNEIDYISTNFDEGNTVEEYYKRMVEENPRNPLLLRNYAHFLHQKGDLDGAEEYYSRAVLEDPSDGQILSLYAGIVWQLHRDNDRADAYFERAVQVAPEDSNVLAAYAKFLWEADAEEVALEEPQRLMPVPQGVAPKATSAY